MKTRKCLDCSKIVKYRWLRCRLCAKEAIRKQQQGATARWRQRNRKRYLKATLKWHREHPESTQRWRENNPNAVHSMQHRASRRLKGRYAALARRFKQLAKRGLKGKILTPSQYEEKVLYVNGRKKACHYCRHEMHDTGGGIDRKDNSLNYTNKNSILCCRGCNAWKNHLHTYLETMKRFKPMRDAIRIGV